MFENAEQKLLHCLFLLVFYGMAVVLLPLESLVTPEESANTLAVVFGRPFRKLGSQGTRGASVNSFSKPGNPRLRETRFFVIQYVFENNRRKLDRRCVS